MAVLAASICSRSGKAILSRQFKDISKDRITALLAAFPTLLADSKSQNTTIEDGNVRYLYQPLEELYVVLITNKHSNILQDIDSLHLFSQTVTSILRGVDEREVLENCFQILGAFDEIINLGYKENLTIQQIKTFLELDSYEEKIQDIIEKNKELEATEERKRRAKEIQRKELARRNMESGFGANNGYEDASRYTQPQQLQTSYAPPLPSISPAPQLQTSRQPPRRGGLQLGKKNKPASDAQQPLLVSTLAPVRQREEEYVPSPSLTPKPAQEKLNNNGILIAINEKVSATISREGLVQGSEIKGDLQLRVNDTSLAHSTIMLDLNKDLDLQFKTHPNVDKLLFNQDSILGLKDKTKGFPSNDQSLGVLRWRGVGKVDDANLLPLTFSCWVNTDGNGVVDITLEYETSERFQDSDHPISQAFIFVPAAGCNALLKEDENNVVSMEFMESGFILLITKLDSILSGSFEFSVECEDEELLFPMEVSFNVENGLSNLSGVEITNITSLSSESEGEELPFDLYYNLASEGYYIV